MVTGQFTGELFTKEHWNSKLQDFFEENSPSILVNNFNDQIKTGESINSLNLNKVYVLVSGSTASASELVINGLNPYIDVILIGTKTVGKYVASITTYDSADYGRDGANPNHTYAMQPIVLEELNKLDENDKDGFEPQIELAEDFNDLGTLGDVNEPLFAAAIADITGTRRSISIVKSLPKVADSKFKSIFNNNMYIDKKINLLNLE
jgi:C-terminal processing protease CtpA/Prc